MADQANFFVPADEQQELFSEVEMPIKHTKVKDTLITVGILIAFFLICLFLGRKLMADALIPAVFSLGVFLVAFFTEGYVYGIAASVVSMLIVNHTFTFPYSKFNFTITENLISAVVMLALTIMTSALTSKLKQQERLKVESEKEKMRANLLRAVSHDLRTPLTTIYGSSSVIIENYKNLTDEEILTCAKGIREDAQWLTGMVENLLSVTRMEGGRVKLTKSTVVLDELIDSVLMRFRKRYPEQKVELDLPDEFISIPMDAVLITQVIVNMLENSVVHAKGMTRLILRVFTEGERAVFEIIDNGCGIPKEQIDEIFTGYYQKKDIPADHQKHNMGIGLTVCASVIKAHGGEIEAENRKEGGCCFRFALKMEEQVKEKI